jgi:hypothetical protein
MKERMSKKELTIVTVTYSFDSEVVAIVFSDYNEAVDYIRKDFENEKRIDTKEGREIDEKLTYCEENNAVLATSYSDDIGKTTWTIATVIDKRQ